MFKKINSTLTHLLLVVIIPMILSGPLFDLISTTGLICSGGSCGG